ncbi:MAG TPA: sulfide/dihydroorotate dehydrogenase-like FAD/NAD-binding protein [Thermodesulfobacteriota bacterium]|nr:sulfide/dihydroorotate dehydrogenase-like FAD/NAD-binding protein [Deltaproteobacteria bacterium]HNR13361.1 sulfide/dihydroorotate dehydrogenase-like FAD/NAD-binding protein [Thermodesulfobacteriota bacterium]HNU71176.1 sulfide/dihydroorotate dehydrogenase-like FAD/NAD-binding protein [Thermodesulfobacteriota bacterium]
MFEILEKRVLGPEIKLFKIKAPAIAQKAHPGQFVIFRIREEGERVPLTINDFDRDAGTISIAFQEVGKSTLLLGRLNEGDAILDLVGPLGRPTEIENFGRVVCIGGGVGTAVIYPVTRALYQAGNHVIGILGARSKDLLILEQEMASVTHRLLISTDDGSKGHKGLVTEVLKQVIEEGEKIDRVIAIGPTIMMKFVAKTTEPYGIKTIVSLNPIMIDGTGMCGVCRVNVGKDTKFACVHGPEFDGHAVDFDLLMSRLTEYKAEEHEALETMGK